MQKSRRDLLKILAKSAASASAFGALAPLSGCTSLDRWVMGETRDEGDKVIVLGAGLAGLAAAYQLKKSQIPFRLIEGSSRIGGRVWTIKDLTLSLRHGELGGERIEMDHQALQTMAQELKVKLLEIDSKDNVMWFEKGRAATGKEWRKEAGDLVKLFQQIQSEIYGNSPQILNLQNRDQFPRAVSLDRMSAAELMDRLSPQMQPWMKGFLEQLIRAEWGVEPFEISSLHLVHFMRDSFRPFGKKYFKVAGGSSVLTQALFDRVGGVIPERFVQFRHQLVEVKLIEGVWSLFFKTPDGRSEYKARRVICTLPPTLLRQVTGWEDLPMAESKKDMVAQMNIGAHGKVLLGFVDRFWGETSVLGTGGSVYTDMVASQITEGGDPGVTGLNSLHGVLQAVVGGKAGESAGLHLVQQVLKDLDKIAVKPVSYENVSYVQNWKMHPWSKGSRSYLKPGQFQIFNTMAQNEEIGNWHFAGESHSLHWMGTMNGAVQTGIDAANRFLKTSS
jgi:monoamine oxidase